MIDDRKRRPATVGDVLASVLQSSGLTERVAQAGIFPEWPRLVGGQIASVTEPVALQQDGTLVVMVTTHAWMQELSLLEPQLLTRINHDAARLPVKKLRWIPRRS
jgi:predicted nucleic acid-binding Zn ribbon protein